MQMGTRVLVLPPNEDPMKPQGGSLDSALLLTQAQYNSNNHLTSGSARPLHTVTRRAVEPNLGFWGNLGFGVEMFRGGGSHGIPWQVLPHDRVSGPG